MQEPNPELPQNIYPDLQTLTDAYDDILKHNSAHTGFGAMFRGILSGTVERQVGSGAADLDVDMTVGAEDVYRGVDDKLQEGVVEGDMNAALQDVIHGDSFMRVGIKIAPYGQFIANTEGRAATSSELVPVIANASLFTEFLSKVQPEAVVEDRSEKFFGDVVTHLSRVTSECFNIENQKYLSDDQKAQLKEAGEDALRVFAAIDPEYARLGIDGVAMRGRVESVSQELSDFLSSDQRSYVPEELVNEYQEYQRNLAKMRVYEGMTKRINYWGRNLLPEYIEAQNGQYLTPPAEQGFGPADWQKDGGQYHWQHAFEFLHRLEKDERTRNFAEEVRQGLVTSIDFALAELDDPAKDIYWRDEGADLANVRKALKGEQFDEVKLAAYMKKPDYMN